MGKRSGFQLREADHYPTPLSAVQPLIPYLAEVRVFAEPCCGDGDLVRHLESFGLVCGLADDLKFGHDARLTDSFGKMPVITNPPYDTAHRRKLLHELIAHFMTAAPFAWLLIDFDWAATRQAASFMPFCSDIVVIGRTKWIADSPYVGKDNHAWFRFDGRHRGDTRFHGHGAKPLKRDTETYRYVLHTDVERLESEGWRRLPALDDTHHGQYSALMQRDEDA